MRCRRRDLSVAPGCVEPPLGDHWIVVEANKIMGDARVPRLTLENRLQDRRSFELIGVVCHSAGQRRLV